MPHVVIAGAVDLRGYAGDFAPTVIREGGDVLRADRIYLDAEGRTALIDALVVEAGRKQPFYVKISAHERGSVTVRIDPLTRVERTEGVKRLVARIGADLLARSPDARVEVTNLVLRSAPLQGSGGSDEDR